MTGLDAILGRGTEPPRCRVVTDQVSVHWWAAGASQGDPCLCGATTRDADEDVAVSREPVKETEA